MVGPLPAAGGRGDKGTCPSPSHTASDAAPTRQRTRAGELLITPKQSENEWYRWLENIQDWCISRQLWWGHRVPAYYVHVEGVKPDVRAVPRAKSLC